MKDASLLAPERAVNDFENVHLKNLHEKRYPPKAHVYLRGKTSVLLCQLI